MDARALGAQLRRRFAADLIPRPAIYWSDCALSAALGWGAFTLALFAPPWLWPALVALAAVLLLRAAFFLHELAHLGPGELPGFRAFWTVVVGLPTLLPPTMLSAHGAHHHPRLYATAADAEYEPAAGYRRRELILGVLAVVLVPPGLVLRFALAPLGVLLPPLGRWLYTRASTLATNPGFRRRPPSAGAWRRHRRDELLASALVWLAALGLAEDVLPWRLPFTWWATVALALAVNQVRTLVAHRYERHGEGGDQEAQLADTLTLEGSWSGSEWMAPLGTRFHALHHLVPKLPYHALPRVHRALMAELPPDHPYRRGVTGGILPALWALWTRAGRASRSAAAEPAALWRPGA